jgi:GT2 family glycosyltransferase
MVDSDTIPPEDALDKLLELDVPIATGITPIIKGNKPYANVYIHAGDVEHPYPIAKTPMGIFEVVGCGASCLLIRRDVLEKMEKPWFKSLEFDNGAVCSEDLFFCEKAIQAGFTITAHSGVRCGHAKTIIV